PAPGDLTPYPTRTFFQSAVVAEGARLQEIGAVVLARSRCRCRRRGRRGWGGDLAGCRDLVFDRRRCAFAQARDQVAKAVGTRLRSEEHTSELQSRENLVC